MLRILAALVLMSVAIAVAVRASPAATGIHRCVNNQGQIIFTDQNCADVDAVESAPSSSDSDSEGKSVIITHTCARKPEDLLFEVRSALEAQDVNRLAGSYLWTGMGTREAYSLMDQLSRFSSRPLVDVQLIDSAPQFDPSASMIVPPYGTESPGVDDEDADRQFDEQDPFLDEVRPPPSPPAVREPDLIRIDQMRSDKDPGAEVSYFRIVPAAGCVWIHY